MHSVSRSIASTVASALVLVAALGPLQARRAHAQTQPAPRPTSSYLHGPFVSVRVALQMTVLQGGKTTAVVRHATVLDRSAIRRLVRAINSVRTVRSFVKPCPGGGTGPGPAWL